MRFPVRAMIALCATTLLPGCVSVIHSTKADGAADGLHYYLPKTFIKLVPATDGTITVEKIYLPDPDNEYVIQAKSFIGKYTLDVSRTEQGFLDTVNYSSDSSGVAKQLALSAGNVRAGEIDQGAAKDKQARDAAKAAADKEASAITAADTLVKSSQLNLDLANRKLNFLLEMQGKDKPPANIADQIFAARLAVEEMQVRLDNAVAAKASLNSVLAAANAPGESKDREPGLFAMEPAFFEVEMSKESVVLRQAFPQKARATWKVPTAKTTASELDVGPAAFVLRPGKDKAFAVKANQELADAALVATTIASTVPPPVIALQNDKLSVSIDLASKTPPGDYTISIGFTTKAKPADVPAKRTFRVRVE